ncbi:NAD(P)-dependent dehydrogenase (short-subunit alcohol dehydrogenase family) [Actinoalloteichus hoggarensis]|uniref:Gluconate 5-dehydrogenase n=1 Tax=Actinoalloteichus hoggarensis TaxID=1470176 RepID=A0A221W7Y0_9PSEU|nr:SDR family oxidoreductase [Actinoalloteichus hoggarensis]ASO22018.1 Gluconate 5-dehydrogenase [Actinoalloteichus hoggarensis]MBB5923901.1 NAD(P)-dependent dehydrogenase (short-subunit alcohol dehydrogenase family) [Actinoalloteichus hoggarensis]
MSLEDKVAAVYGGGGAIGGAVARAFARHGARVFLAGRSGEPMERVVAEIEAAGAVAESTVLDALDEAAVDAFVDDVAGKAGRIDVSFNLIGLGDVQQPLTEISVDDFLTPITTAMRSHFLTTRAAARHMIPQGSGVVLAFGGSGPQTMPGLGGFKIALDALEGLRRQWACELGGHGIRVVTLTTGGVPESIPADFATRQQITEGIARSGLLGRAATLSDVGEVAAFVASDAARTITSAAVNMSCGAIVD